MRKPFQGVWNIIRFNWHFYLGAILWVIALIISVQFVDLFMARVCICMACGSFIVTAISLFVSWYVYDYSPLYSLEWLDKLIHVHPRFMTNIHAGLDEFSYGIQQKYKGAKLEIFDFYNALDYKEISIVRARKAYPAQASTLSIALDNIPLEESSQDVIFLMFAAHEIRNDCLRILFFKEIQRCITDDGCIILVEHVRDWNNFFAYTIGVFHFMAKGKWLKTFTDAGLKLKDCNKITPFVNIFILGKHGNSL